MATRRRQNAIRLHCTWSCWRRSRKCIRVEGCTSNSTVGGPRRSRRRRFGPTIRKPGARVEDGGKAAGKRKQTSADERRQEEPLPFAAKEQRRVHGSCPADLLICTLPLSASLSPSPSPSPLSSLAQGVVARESSPAASSHARTPEDANKNRAKIASLLRPQAPSLLSPQGRSHPRATLPSLHQPTITCGAVNQDFFLQLLGANVTASASRHCPSRLKGSDFLNVLACLKDVWPASPTLRCKEHANHAFIVGRVEARGRGLVHPGRHDRQEGRVCHGALLARADHGSTPCISCSCGSCGSCPAVAGGPARAAVRVGV